MTEKKAILQSWMDGKGWLNPIGTRPVGWNESDEYRLECLREHLDI